MRKIVFLIIFVVNLCVFAKDGERIPTLPLPTSRVDIWGDQGKVAGIVDSSELAIMSTKAPVIHKLSEISNQYVGFVCDDFPMRIEHIYRDNFQYQITNIPLEGISFKECENLIYSGVMAKEDRPLSIYFAKNGARKGGSILAVKYRGAIIYPKNFSPELELETLLQDMVYVDHSLNNQLAPTRTKCN